MLAPNPNIVTVPTDEPDLIKRLSMRSRLTPDFHEMRFFKKIPIFIYGPEKKGGIWHANLQGARYLGKAITALSCYHMQEYNEVPVVFHEHAITQPRAKIKGELYEVDVGGLMMMDLLYQHTIMYRRQKINIQLLDQAPKHCKFFGMLPLTNAFIYLAFNTDRWSQFDLKNKGITRYPQDEKLKHAPFYEHMIYIDSWGNENESDFGWGRHAYANRREDSETKRNVHPLEDLNSDDDPHWQYWAENYGGVNSH